MLSGLWYEYLATLNSEMVEKNRRIALVTDNCPHIELIYLSKNTTPCFQPLDQGIIRSFKAAYRRQYAQNLVQIFNSTGNTKSIDILKAIHFISDAWKELPLSVIYNCWQEAGIHPRLEKIDNLLGRKSYDKYLEYLQTGTTISIDSLLSNSIGSYHSVN